MANQHPADSDKPERLEPYQYHSLDSSSGQIRLLCIPPKNASSSVSVEYTLSHAQLRDRPSFVALSYCWGDQALAYELKINGQLMHVTESLATALTSLRSEDGDALVWADAICINQQDPVEKTKQVQLMRDIYKAASRVIIWLGASTPETYCTMKEMHNLGNELLHAGLWDLTSDEIIHWDVADTDNSKAALTKRTIDKMKAEHLVQARNDKYPFWWIMSDLGKRKWFHRMWCIQECTNASIATFRCGRDEVDFTRLWAVALYFRIFSSHSHHNLDGDVQAFWKDNWLTKMLSSALPTTVISIRRKYLMTGGQDLRTLLDTIIIRDSNHDRIDATDPRDRVYALLGIANDEAAKEIVADYTLSCEQAYITTARALLRHGHDDILSCCRIRGTCENLPSWVPDWSADLRKPWSVWHVKERLFNASGEGNKTLEISELADSTKLFENDITLKGYFVDTIKGVGHPFRHGFDANLDWTLLKFYFKDIQDFLSQSSRYTPLQKEEGEWRIPVGDTEVAELNVQMLRASPNSHMKAGYAVAKQMGGKEPAPDEYVKSNFLPFACFCCQLARMYDSRPFISESGYVGVCPLEGQSGDSIVIFRGARVPYIVRKVADETKWTLIGESHVYGIMDGEYMVTNPAAEDITLC